MCLRLRTARAGAPCALASMLIAGDVAIRTLANMQMVQSFVVSTSVCLCRGMRKNSSSADSYVLCVACASRVRARAGLGSGGTCTCVGVLCIVLLYLVDWRFGNPVVDFIFYAIGLLAFIGPQAIVCVIVCVPMFAAVK